MRMAVVIPALDEEEWIAAAVASAQAPGVEVVVVDGGSRDATAARALAAGARIVESAAGRARQLDAGWRATDAEAVLFLHADTRLPAGFDAAVREALRDPDVAGGAFRLRFDRRSLGLRIIEWGVAMRVAWAGLPYGDQAIFARRKALEAIGGVPQAPIMEDLDLVRALRREGRMRWLGLPVVTSARRYQRRGVLRTFARNALALAAWRLGLPRERVAAWYRR